MGLPKFRLIMFAVSLCGNPLCRWFWWNFHVYVVSYVSLGRSPYRRAFFEECTGVSLCTFVVFGC